jgi:hypothetical protein
MMRGLRIVAAVVSGLLALAPAARAVDKETVQRAIDKGVAYLKQVQGQNGSWSYSQDGNDESSTTGATALAGMTLLECGVPANDPAVQKAATFVRERSIALTKTYGLSLSIMFLDRLGDARDANLIESMALRLLAGQNPSGGWTYGCPSISAEETARLKKLLEQRNELVAGDLPKAGDRREVKDLPKEIQNQLDQVQRAQGVATATGYVGGDNSNTQFAILALWVARRQGIPVEAALRRIDARFRGTQNNDGGWSYMPMGMRPPGGGGPPPGMPMPGIMGSTPAMTCAGLLGLALSHGGYNEAVLRTEGKDKEPARDGKGKPPSDPNKDPAVKNGLVALGTAIGQPGQKDKDPTQNQPIQFKDAQGHIIPVPMINGRFNGRGFYFLWSLERVAVAYGLDTIGGKDWYGWGAAILLGNQQDNGSWQGLYGEGGVDTCFALLFLRRANLAEDLTALLKGRITDPDQRELHAVGNDDLKKKLGLKPAFGGDDQPEPPGSESNRKPKPAGTEKADSAAGRLSAELVNAAEGKREEVLKKLRDSKGGEFTEALADAIGKLTGELKTKARDALAERMARMTAGTLKDKLRDDDLEVRRAAALAVAMKEEKPLVPRLIELLDDPEAPVARAAHAALKSLSNQDFGPGAEATRAERAQAIAAWKDWWAKQGDK